MNNKKNGLNGLAKKILTVASSALGLIGNTKGDSIEHSSYSNINSNDLIFENYKSKKANPKLVLKLNINNPSNSLMVSHRSHSSHRSHYSHYSGGSSRGDGGSGLGGIVVGGLIAYGAYKIISGGRGKKGK